jgi:hypothetical protein
MDDSNISLESELLGMTWWYINKPVKPHEYDAYYDTDKQTCYIYYNDEWIIFSTVLTKKHERYLKLKILGFDEND